MAKQLYLVRHAETVNKSRHQADIERELTPAGVQQSLRIGAYLSGERFLLDAIFISTAERARQTAFLAAETMKLDIRNIFPEEDLYEASPRTFFDFITKIDNAFNYVMCVGHNPTISYVAEYLTKAEIGEMVPGGIAIISFDVSSWAEVSQGNGGLIYHLNPNMIAKT